MMNQIRHKRTFVKGALYGALAAFLVCVLIFTGLILAGKISIYTGAISSGTARKAQQLERLIESQYLYPEDIKENTQQDMSLKGYVASLGDPYSAYYNQEETKELFQSSEGEYAGIGALMSQDPDTGEIKVEEVYEDSPAKKAGMKKGDIFYAIDGEALEEEPLSDVVSKVKGEEGTKVTIIVLRESNKVELEITRGIVENHTVTAEMKDDGIGYLKISEFDNVTYKQFQDGLSELEEQGMKGLMVDLRDNPGGNLTTVCEILDLILPEGTIVYTEDKNGKRIDTEKSDEEHQFTKPLAVLVNGNSASASEIFTGAVQDYEVGTIVGTKTFGKGIVQTIFPLRDGSSVKLTTAQYFTPDGRSIHKKGITPDVEVEYEKAEDGTDNQLEKALDVIKGEIK